MKLLISKILTGIFLVDMITSGVMVAMEPKTHNMRAIVLYQANKLHAVGVDLPQSLMDVIK